jgi:POT family proton-dependent oligopeptide transporter
MQDGGQGLANGGVSKGGEFRGHPKGLYVCFLTEMWERFSYYGMRAILIFYLTRHFLLSDQQSIAIFGAYASLVYAAPVIGGLLADRYLGFRKAVTLGAVLLVIGHFGMAFEGSGAVERIAADGSTVIERDGFFLQTMYLSLAFIAIGVGFLKPNISTVVGSLYEQGDPRRDSAFTIFYMGINIGAASASLLCGYLGETYGWRYGFGLAGIGMLLGLLIFLRGQKHLEGHAEPRDPDLLRQRVFALFTREHLIYLGALVAVVGAWYLIQHNAHIGQLLTGFGVVVVGAVLAFSLFKCDGTERDRMLVALGLTAFSVLFWSLFEQAGSSLNLFADRNVDRTLLGMEIKASMFQSLNPAFIIILAPLFSALWLWLARRGLEPSTPVKFALGLIQAGLGFMALVFGAQFAGDDFTVAMFWLALAYFLHTTGELCVSPVGLSMVTKLSVKRVVGMMMGVWLLSNSAAHYIAALIASETSVETVGGAVLDPEQSLVAYMDVFEYIGIVGMIGGVVLLLISPIMRRAMHGIR